MTELDKTEAYDMMVAALQELGERASNTQAESTRTTTLEIVNRVFRTMGKPRFVRK